MVFRVSLLELQSRLLQYYARKRREDPEHQISELQHFGSNWIGSLNKPSLSAKAAQTVGLLPFLLELLNQYSDLLPRSDEIIRCGEVLQLFFNECKRHGRKLPADVLPAMQAFAREHVELLEALGWDTQPKHHMYVHLSLLLASAGNPRIIFSQARIIHSSRRSSVLVFVSSRVTRSSNSSKRTSVLVFVSSRFTSTYYDESINMKVGKIVSSLHRRTWMRRALVRFGLLLAHQRTTRKTNFW